MRHAFCILLIGLDHPHTPGAGGSVKDCSAEGVGLGYSAVGFSRLCAARAPFIRYPVRTVAMAGDQALRDETLLAAVTEAMVAMHEHYHGRAPAAAKSLMMGDDLLACVLGGVYTEVEKTMIELQRSTIVQQPRSAF